MLKRITSATIGILAIAILASATGCTTSFGPKWNAGLLSYPIPVSPYFQKKAEDNLYEKERYERVPILGPITGGAPPTAMDPPSDDEIMRALEKARPLEGGLPFLHEVQRNNVRIVKDLIGDYIDEVRNIPMVGPTQLHHAHYKCTVYFSETTWVGWPVPYKHVDEDCVEVLYIDHDHLHMAGNVDGGLSSNY